MDKYKKPYHDALPDLKPIDASIDVDGIRTPNRECAHPSIIEIVEVNNIASNDPMQNFRHHHLGQSFISYKEGIRAKKRYNDLVTPSEL